jgi:hypothetical protein
VITPPQTYRFFKPGITLAIKMANDEKSLEPYSALASGYHPRPKDAARFSSRVLPDRFAGQSSRVPRISYHGDLKNEADKGGVDALLGYIKENVPGY